MGKVAVAAQQTGDGQLAELRAQIEALRADLASKRSAMRAGSMATLGATATIAAIMARVAPVYKERQERITGVVYSARLEKHSADITISRNGNVHLRWLGTADRQPVVWQDNKAAAALFALAVPAAREAYLRAWLALPQTAK